MNENGILLSIFGHADQKIALSHSITQQAHLEHCRHTLGPALLNFKAIYTYVNAI